MTSEITVASSDISVTVDPAKSGRLSPVKWRDRDAMGGCDLRAPLGFHPWLSHILSCGFEVEVFNAASFMTALDGAENRLDYQLSFESA